MMDHLANWIEIPVTNMERAKGFYRKLLDVDVQKMKLGDNNYAIFSVKDRFNTGCLVKGEGYVPSMEGVTVYLNGGKELSQVLARVEKAGGKIVLKKTFLSEQAGHIAYFKDTEGNKIGLYIME
jgi:predicted enzyme related to lactoylglutathione lyase